MVSVAAHENLGRRCNGGFVASNGALALPLSPHAGKPVTARPEPGLRAAFRSSPHAADPATSPVAYFGEPPKQFPEGILTLNYVRKRVCDRYGGTPGPSPNSCS
jgi:hypothetical protein